MGSASGSVFKANSIFSGVQAVQPNAITNAKLQIPNSTNFDSSRILSPGTSESDGWLPTFSLGGRKEDKILN